MRRIDKLEEKYPNEGFKNRKKMAKQSKQYRKLANAIRDNLIRIMKRNKTISGDVILSDEQELLDGIERLRNSTIGETTQTEGTHTINKKSVYLCDAQHPDDNTLAHVLIHEFAHVLNSTVGHDEKWTRLFDILQELAHEEKWFNRYKRIELQTYCGGKYNG